LRVNGDYVEKTVTYMPIVPFWRLILPITPLFDLNANKEYPQIPQMKLIFSPSSLFSCALAYSEKICCLSIDSCYAIL
jgi:hypothetical protein